MNRTYASLGLASFLRRRLRVQVSGNAAAATTVPRRLWPLPGLGSGAAANAASAAIIAILLATRFAWLPNGPWEQDEAIFATGVLDFDIVRHRPHPPGFPGWILLGKLLGPFVSDSLLGLRVWSCLASVVGVVILSQLLVPLCGSGSALLGALVYAFAPLTWTHSARAFACIPALTVVLLAIWLWTARADAEKPWASLAAWALIAFAATMRPQLAPELAVVAVLGFWADGHRPRRLLLGVAVALFVFIGVFAAAVSVGGGAAAVWKATTSHLAEAKEVAGGNVPWAELGIVRGLGGSVPAAIVVVASSVGLCVGVVRNRWTGAWLALLVIVTAWALLFMHSASIPRYNVALVLALTPAVLLAVSILPRLAQTLLLLAVGAATAWTTFPVVRAMHEQPLPPVAALRRAAALEPKAVLYPHKLFSFGRLAGYTGMITAPVVDVTGNGLVNPLQRGSALIEGPSLRFLPDPMACSELFEGFPNVAWALSQRRFTKAWLARDPVVLGDGVYNVERLYGDGPFAWLSESAVFHVPGPADHLLLRLRVNGDRAPQRIEAWTGEEQLLSTKLDSGLRFVWLALPRCDQGCMVRLALPDAVASESDRRKLSVRLEAVIAPNPHRQRAENRWSPGRPDTVRAAQVQLVGMHGPETFAEGRRGAWTGPEATVTFSGRGGVVVLQLARPWFSPGPVVVSTDVDRAEVRIGPTVQAVAVRLGSSPGEKSISIRTPTFVPSEVGPRSTDNRRLGVMFFDAEYIPPPDCGSYGAPPSRSPA